MSRCRLPLANTTVALITLALAVATPGTLGCSSLISHADYDRLPHDARQEIFDAENDLIIARNREDAAEDRRQAFKQALAELDSRWERTAQHLAKSPAAAGRGPQARKVRDAQEAYLSAELQVAEVEIQTTRLDTAVSRARLALVRQRQLARIGRVTGASLKPLEAAVAAREANQKAATVAATTVRTRAEQGLEAWKAAEDEYARASGGDYDTVVWGE
jgi:hypothetical protein